MARGQVRSMPTATFTPTAAGLRSAAPEGPIDAPSMQAMIADAIRQGIAAGLQQISRLAPAIPDMAPPSGRVPDIPVMGVRDRVQEKYLPERSTGTQSDISDNEGHLDLDLSEDKGILPDPPASSGLFQPGLFKSVLFKAKNTANLGDSPLILAESSQGLTDPLFAEHTTETEVLPYPQIFVDAVQ